MLQYLKFLLKSTNQHGVHSPFVYNLVTKCFYDKEKTKAHKSIKRICRKNDISYKKGKLLNRIPRYFDYKNVLVLDNKKEITQELLSLNNPILIDQKIHPKRTYDLIHFTLPRLQHYLRNDVLFSLIHNDSTIIIDSLYNSKDEILIWEEIKRCPKITVTIDTFYLGFVFIRKEQAKEHFTIRN
ncbi:hypothetical protein U6A24_15735 [Aquimarina gracilis]|uniref:Uncharacterized protein n=1 Tax=Aquimarina gracilis TaxID=874422 RepID=A0ABU5ZYN8_9FLAO|nr:hypothetical protein [Aquimarina gracilis]MEB3346925.1 hypothetical protein [Aquimarina gracilis]